MDTSESVAFTSSSIRSFNSRITYSIQRHFSPQAIMRHYHQHAYLSPCSASQRSFASSKGFSVSSGGKLFIPTNSPVGISSFVPHYIQPVPPTYVTEYEYAYTSPQSKLDFQRRIQAKQRTKPCAEELKKVKMVDKGVSTDQLAQWEKLSHLAAELNEECGDLLPQSLLTDVHKVADSRAVSSQFEKVCSRLKDVVRACTEDSEDNHNGHHGNQNGNHQNGHRNDGFMSRAVNQPLQERGQQREEATDTQQDRATELCLAFIDCAEDIKRCC